MPDNPQALPGQVFALPDHHLIALEGRDAAVFAQAQFMNDVKSLADGHWQWSGWLTPKGRVIALFALLRVSDQSIRLLLPDADAAAIAQSLRRFVFRSKVAIALREDLVIEGRFGAPVRARGSAIGFDPAVEGSAVEGLAPQGPAGEGPAGEGPAGESLELDFSGDGGARSLRIHAGPAVPVDAAAQALWMQQDLRHGLPRLPASQAEQWTPQQLSLERLRAFSVKKGCYPGQEIVARTHFLGKAKRWLALYRAQAPVPVGASVAAGTDSLGTIVSSADDWALAVINQERGPDEVGAADIRLQPQALSAGLER